MGFWESLFDYLTKATWVVTVLCLVGFFIHAGYGIIIELIK
jgi:hypothetical protein